MKPQKYNLIVAAHPDDEAIFFSGLILTNRQLPWKVICATDGNADGRGLERSLEFKQSCTELGVEFIEQWDYKDLFEQRLPIQELIDRLKKESPTKVYTHGPIGEYAHPHHQDVCYAVSQSFDEKQILCASFNCYPDEVIQLTSEQYLKKCSILNSIYKTEIEKFVNLLPATWCEGFSFIEKAEIQTLYEHFVFKKTIDTSVVKTFKWLLPVLKNYQVPLRF